MKIDELELFYAESVEDWRQWLADNHQTKKGVWLVSYRKSANVKSVNWSDSVDEALCFGWIDSVRKSIDERSYKQFFTQRKPNSGWSKINKEKVENLIANGRMTPSGLKSIELAKTNGSWNILDEVEELKIPAELLSAFDSFPGSLDYFESLSKSVKKMILHWVISAKRSETKEKRIAEIAECASMGRKPKHIP